MTPYRHPAPDAAIDLQCPACGYTWHAAAELGGVWWGKGVTPEAIAALCHCPKCHAGPPMQPAPPPALFDRACPRRSESQ